MVMTMPRMTPAHMAMNLARRDLPHRMWAVCDQLNLTLPQWLSVVGLYTVDTLRRGDRRPAPPKDVAPELAAVDAAVSAFRVEHPQITNAQLLVLLCEHQTEIANAIVKYGKG